MLNRRQFTLASASALGALAMGISQPAFAQAEKVARFRLTIDPEGLYNVQSISLVVSEVLGNYLLESLVYLDEKGQAKPWLAESWEPSADGKVITFKLKPGKVFHDGTPFNAAAVKFHFDTVMDPKNASPSRAMINPLQKVETSDDMTVVFTFSKPFAPFINLLGLSYFGFNSPTAVKAAGSAYPRHPVGTGPFKFGNWTPGTSIELVRNAEFKQYRPDAKNQGPAYLDRIVLNVLAEEGVVTSALQTGELQAALLTADAVRPLEGDKQFNIINDQNAKNLMFMEFDYKKPPFDDKAFREAVSYAIDRESVLAAAFGGNGKIALGPLSRGIPGYDDTVAQKYGTPYDPEKAKALLDAAGWKVSGDIRAKGSMQAKFTVRSYASSTTERALAVIQANLADVGIQVDVGTADWGTFYPGLLKPDWDMDLNRWTWPDPSVMSQLFRSPGHRQLLPANPAIDQALDSADAALDPAKRFQFVSDGQKAILEDRLILPLLTDWPITVVRSELEGYRLDFLGRLYASDLKITG
ncbi:MULTISPECIES: ABC transporter substrate-binding protein [Rhizobium/Agrobacterium group]|uniref:ABC transporter substrate-binding protein n=2 Tax=Neorhizobium TaxID=1525371 RepID=A0ABV0M755_9HYPH|nr:MULTISPECIES: ABC transporter substrate-binding protein [Rhizobium/Agrobacterium group]MCC2610976.1 ABC transporter substrate-binding protein [Neorhizobium petrolearium]WGI66196.1 ABC transporter substrate-binding protein [Neorhizobium petrolearium]